MTVLDSSETIAFSTRGERSRRPKHKPACPAGGEVEDTSAKAIGEAAALVLADLEHESLFFLLAHSQHDSNRETSFKRASVPVFDPNEVKAGAVLGHGEFGIVHEILAFSLAPAPFESRQRRGKFPSGDRGKVMASALAKFGATTTTSTHSEGPTGVGHSDVSNRQVVGVGSLLQAAEDSKQPDHVNYVGDDWIEHNKLDQFWFLSDLDDDENDNNSKTDTKEQPGETNSSRGAVDSLAVIDVDHHLLRRRMAKMPLWNGQARYAIKTVKKDVDRQLRVDAALDLACEARYLAHLSHSSIIRLRGLVGEPGTPSFGLILDRLTQTLDEKMDFWKKSIRLSSGVMGLLGRKESERKSIFEDRLLAALDTARALRYLHQKRILYRDLKPQNIGFNVRGDVEIFDFGLAKELKAKDLVEEPDGYDATGLTGSRRYMAPEVVRCQLYGFSADVYSFGILFWEIFALRLAFPSYDRAQHFDRVVQGQQRPRRLPNMPQSLQHLMAQCWDDDRGKRPTFKEICQVLQNAMAEVSTTTSDMSDRSTHLANRSCTSLNDLSE